MVIKTSKCIKTISTNSHLLVFNIYSKVLFYNIVQRCYVVEYYSISGKRWVSCMLSTSIKQAENKLISHIINFYIPQLYYYLNLDNNTVMGRAISTVEI